MALNDDSVALDDERLKAEPHLALVMGTEGDGLLSYDRRGRLCSSYSHVPQRRLAERGSCYSRSLLGIEKPLA